MECNRGMKRKASFDNKNIILSEILESAVNIMGGSHQ